MAPCSAIAFDIEKYFDEIDHSILKERWKSTLQSSKLPNDHYAIYKSLTKFSYVDRDLIFKKFKINGNSKKNGIYRICNPNEFRDIVRKNKYIVTNSQKKGIPQGSPISGLLSNIYLLNFDIELHRISQYFGASYLRYCDDILIICKEDDELFFKNIILAQLYKHKLCANNKKTVTRHFSILDNTVTCDNPLQYLGFIFNGKQTTIRSSSYNRFLHKMRNGVELARQTRRKYNVIRNSKEQSPRAIYRRYIYSRYSYLGRRNFISYAHKAARIMNENAIRKQVKPLWRKLLERIQSAES